MLSGASDDSETRVGGEGSEEKDGKGMDNVEDDEACDSEQGSDGLLSGRSLSSVTNSNVFASFRRNFKGGEEEERLSIGEGGGWGDCAVRRREVE